LSILSESLKKFYTTKIEECQRNDGEQRAHYKCEEKLQETCIMWLFWICFCRSYL